MSSARVHTIRLAVVAAFTLAAFTSAQACLRCGPAQVTLSEQIQQSDAVVLVEWVAGVPTKGQVVGSTTYRIESVFKCPQNLLKKDNQIVLSRYLTGKAGQYFILMGSRAAVIEWGIPLEISKAAFEYLVKAPNPRAPQKKRLAYYLKYLEYPDLLVANDAFSEFANADYHDIVLLADQLPQKRIRKWVGNPQTPGTRLGLYGLLLGLCGTAEDAKLMRELIVKPTEDFRLGIDGLMIGYILLNKEEGLDLIDRTKLKAKYLLGSDGKPLRDENGQPRALPFSETYAAMQALRFMQRYASNVIKPERLNESMRLLLDRPELADLVIADLARWKDWGVQDKLMTLYRADEYNIPSIKRAIIRYMLVSTKDMPEDKEAETPAHVTSGKKHLAALEKMDPKTVREAKRFFFLQ